MRNMIKTHCIIILYGTRTFITVVDIKGHGILWSLL